MFKTIQECRLDLVAYSEAVSHAVEEKHGVVLYDRLDMDFMPCSAARVSFGNEDKTGKNKEADVKLMKYLADHKHVTPFEYQHATFLIECPLFIRSQIHRHRAFSYNEISRRYTDEDLGFWLPDKFRGQHKSSKQASSEEVVTKIRMINEVDSWECEPGDAYINTCISSQQVYTALVSGGVAREIARAVLPQSLLTKFYMGGNLRSWAHFIELRRDEHAQFEVQVIAERVAEALRKLWPESCKALGI